jgi:ubiquinone/menaquinone biosynthesis C-methylase UbiE
MCDCDMEKMLNEREALLVRDYDTALDFAGFDARDTILDVATGSGRMLLQTVKRGYRVISGDVDPGALDRARERLGDLADKPTLVILDAHKLQFDDGSFHAITFANAIHEINDPRGALDEITRVLAADGKLLVVEFNAKGFELMELHHRMQGRGEHPKGEMPAEEIDKYLRSSFDRVEVRESSITHAWIASGKSQRSSR